MRRLVVVMVGAAAVQRVVQAERYLAIWRGVVPGLVAAGRLQRLMVCMPAPFLWGERTLMTCLWLMFWLAKNDQSDFGS